MTDLLPCPFCGVTGVILSDGKREWALFEHEDSCLFPNFHKHEIPACDFAGWNTRADSYTREDVEGAFVSGYSLGSLPVGSDPRWDQNEQTMEDEMAEWGWVRERTCQMNRIKKFPEYEDCAFECWECSVCKRTNDEQRPRFCPNCGAKVVEQ